MLVAVIGDRLIRDIVHRTAHQIQVIEEKRSGEGQFQVHRAAGEEIMSLGSLDISRFLYGSLGKDAHRL